MTDLRFGRRFDSSVASSAAEGRVLLRERRPQGVVSDIGMPGEDGYAFVQRIRHLGAAQGGSTPAVALTAFARTEDRMRALAAGFQMHLAKPVDPSELVLVLRSVANRGSEAANGNA